MNPLVCSESTYVREKANSYPENSSFISNCQNYFKENTVTKCFKCQDDYILTFEKTHCVKGLAGCKIAAGPDACFECQTDRFLYNSRCSATGVQFCE